MEYTTSATQKIWIVTFKENSGNRSQRVAAYDFKEVLSFFNESGISKIIKIELTEDEVTYHY